MSLAPQFAAQIRLRQAGESAVGLAMRPVQLLVASPALLLMGTMAVMLFRPPDVKFFALDRVFFGLMVITVLLRICALRLPLQLPAAVTWPLAGLGLFALVDLVGEPFEAQNWSVFAAKWVVPLAFYLLAGYAFQDNTTLRRFETFALIVLAYLSFTAIASAMGASALVFPRYILDSSLGIHADRARGPFLQAVANGVSLNLLGLLAINAFRRGRLRGPLSVLLIASLPVAILATKTRAVWLSFAASVVIVLITYYRACLCRMRWVLIVSGIVVAGGLVTLTSSETLHDRLQDSGPLEYRMAVYDAGWQMFTEKPLFGWAASSIQTELSARISGFTVDAFYLHDTYLEIAVQHGLIGLGLYAWVIADLLRLGRKCVFKSRRNGFLDPQFRPLWRVMVLVYLVNASFVVMNYQFVNALLFTIAGLLAAQNQRALAEADAAD